MVVHTRTHALQARARGKVPLEVRPSVCPLAQHVGLPSRYVSRFTFGGDLNPSVVCVLVLLSSESPCETNDYKERESE